MRGTFQRRRGLFATIWRSHVTTDRRGNKTRTVDWERREKGHPDGVNPHVERATYIPERGAKAELPGQQQINVTRITIAHALEGVDLYSEVHFDGKVWDVVTPPGYHHGTRHTRHWTLSLRERPS